MKDFGHAMKCITASEFKANFGINQTIWRFASYCFKEEFRSHFVFAPTNGSVTTGATSAI